jgi:hypothetical protein
MRTYTVLFGRESRENGKVVQEEEIKNYAVPETELIRTLSNAQPGFAIKAVWMDYADRGDDL